MPRIDFSPERLPWLDRHIAEIDAYVDQIDLSELKFDLRKNFYIGFALVRDF